MNANYAMQSMGSTSLSSSNMSLSSVSGPLSSVSGPGAVPSQSHAAVSGSNGSSNGNPALDPIDRLKFFLATAPTSWKPGEAVKRYNLGNGEQISCVYWKNLFYITGTDIVKILLFRFQAIHRAVVNTKKFEEGIFSDLRNLKPGVDATLEEPRSEFLEVLYRHGCIRTQKKQKVFFWFSVPHDRLFMDALERDLKRESNMIHVNSFLTKSSMMTPNMGQMSLGNSPMMFHGSLPVVNGGGGGGGGGMGGGNGHSGATAAMYGSLQGSPAMGTSTLMNAYMPSAHQLQMLNHHGSPVIVPLQQQQQQPQQQQHHSHSSVGNMVSNQLQYNRSPPQPNWQYVDASYGDMSSCQGVAYAQPTDMASSASSLSLVSSQPLAQGSQEFIVSAPHQDYTQSYAPTDMYEVDDSMIGALINEEGMVVGDEGEEEDGDHDRESDLGDVSLTLIDNNCPAASVDPFGIHSASLFGYDYSTGTIIEDPSSGAESGLAEGRSYECTFSGCGRNFKRVEHLKRHYRSHTGERPFICPVEGCGKSFSRSDNLAQHSKVHLGLPLATPLSSMAAMPSLSSTMNTATAMSKRDADDVSGVPKDYLYPTAASEHRETQAQGLESLMMPNMNQRRPLRPPTDNILNVIEDSYGFLQ